MPTTTERIAGKVRGLAAEHRLTQQRLAGLLGLSRTSLVARINGRVPFSAPEIHALAAALDEPIDRFFPDPARQPAKETT
ncbi:helix-turn-helix domain-containing protein [Microbacterium sp. G2-8]|uniref:helix-turn-helix domain-containing protein n=1 Tax=Microbacterium sp. G2-8 TaxID=2842454 RepID=UPI001C8ADE20|nr:helix-turn-helix transcriptional regulator [Microbacterium sp. G2-8]